LGLNNITWRPEARIVKSEAPIARRLLVKHISDAMNTQSKIE
jgi:hypothetical protein